MNYNGLSGTIIETQDRRYFIPLDASLVKGSHGRIHLKDEDKALYIGKQKAKNTLSPISIAFSLINPAIFGRFESGIQRSAHSESDRKILTKSLHLFVGTYTALFLLSGTNRLINLLDVIDLNLSVNRFLEILRLF